MVGKRLIDGKGERWGSGVCGGGLRGAGFHSFSPEKVP